MNERGFFNIVGLCLLLVAAIFMKGIQEFETNYARGITNFQAEHELQNAADSALISAVENGSTATQIFNSGKFGKITVEIQCQTDLKDSKLYIRRFERQYLSNNKIKDTALNVDNTFDTNNNEETPDETPEWLKAGTVWISVASCDSPLIVGKIYRRSFACVLDDEPETIYYLKSF